MFMVLTIMKTFEWVELGPTGLAIRIFRSKKAAALYSIMPSRGLGPEPIIRQMERSVAVGQIRRQVFERDQFECVHCGQLVVWERGSWNSGEMDERDSKGHGGEVSVENGQLLCHTCHQGPHGKHQRQPQWSSGPGQ